MTYAMLAYLGPGGALSAIGAFLALLAAVALALVGFVWYPLKRFLSWRRERNKPNDATVTPEGAPPEGGTSQEVPPA